MNIVYDLRTFIWILIINACVTAVYLLVNIFRKTAEHRSYILKSIMMLLCPVVGPLYIFIGWFLLRTVFHKPVNLEDVIFSKDRESILIKAEEEKERNIVPIEDALLINEKGDSRSLLLDVIKRSPKKSLHGIALALDSDDSELSHYAAAVIQNELDKSRKLIRNTGDRLFALEKDLSAHEAEGGDVLKTEAGRAFSEKKELLEAQKDAEADGENRNAEKNYYADISPELESSKDYSKRRDQALRQGLLAKDAEIEERKTLLQELTEEMEQAHRLIAEIDSLIGQELLSPFETARFTETLDKVAALIEKRDVLDAPEIEMLVQRHIELGDFEAAKAWCDKIGLFYPESISYHSAHIKLLHAMGEHDAFFEAIEEMKRSGVHLNKEMLELVRFFGAKPRARERGKS